MTVLESQSFDDPSGRATFSIIRAGILGTVNVQWRLEPEAMDDFVPPIFGTIRFDSVNYSFLNVLDFS